MSGIYSVAGIAAAAAILAVFIREYRAEYSVMIALAVSAAALIFALPKLSESFNFMQSVAFSNAVVSKRAEPIFKALGIAVVTEIASGICRDAKENGMAAKVELAGRCAVTVLAIPLASELLSTVTRILG